MLGAWGPSAAPLSVLGEKPEQGGTVRDGAVNTCASSGQQAPGSGSEGPEAVPLGELRCIRGPSAAPLFCGGLTMCLQSTRWGKNLKRFSRDWASQR